MPEWAAGPTFQSRRKAFEGASAQEGRGSGASGPTPGAAQEMKMFDPYTDFVSVTPACDLLAETGIDPRTVREVIEDNRRVRCPERGAVFPAHGFAGLVPDPAAD